jgi:retron-type reverse transcriptase
MKLDKNIENEIIIRWSLIHDINDFISLLNYINTFVFCNHKIQFNSTNLISLSNIYNKSRFRNFRIRTKNKTRIINAPSGREFNQLLKCIGVILNLLYTPHSSAKGYINGLSIKDNAVNHTAKKYVFNTDIVSFFDNINQRIFIKYIEKLNSKNGNIFTLFLLQNLIANLCFYYNDASIMLPQGAPTSPVISNIICQSLDEELYELSRTYYAHYSRYADDITFSSNSKFFLYECFIKELDKILNKYGFQRNLKKTRLQGNNSRQEVTGLIVNEKINVNKKYIKELRMLLYYWETYGEIKSYELYKKYKIIKEPRFNYGRYETTIESVIKGKLAYLKMIKGDDDIVYRKLFSRFNLLVKKGGGLFLSC